MNYRNQDLLESLEDTLASIKEVSMNSNEMESFVYEQKWMHVFDILNRIEVDVSQ